MDIGTGKPKRQITISNKQLALLRYDTGGQAINNSQLTNYLVDGITHHLFDIINPDEDFNVFEFKKLAEEKITEIQNRHHVPIIVGGTGLYIDALVYDFGLVKSYKNKKEREKMEKKSTEELYKELQEIDPETAEKIDPKNKRRLIRALEIYYQTKKSKATQETRKKLPKNVLYFAINIPREELYEKINKRVYEMFIVQNLDYEVKGLLKKYPADLPIMNTMGYRETIQYINKEITLEEAIEKTQQAHRNYAKKQMTWFRRNKDIIWIKADLKKIEEYLIKGDNLDK